MYVKFLPSNISSEIGGALSSIRSFLLSSHCSTKFINRISANIIMSNRVSSGTDSGTRNKRNRLLSKKSPCAPNDLLPKAVYRKRYYIQTTDNKLIKI